MTTTAAMMETALELIRQGRFEEASHILHCGLFELGARPLAQRDDLGLLVDDRLGMVGILQLLLAEADGEESLG
jgi:hypothetical protein